MPLKKLSRLPVINLKKTREEFKFNLPISYVVSKFYEFGYKVKHNAHTNTYNCCCPLCREGTSWGKQRRCYYLPDDDRIYCHNCGKNYSTYKWIREVSGWSHDQLRESLERDAYDVVDFGDQAVKTLNIPTLPEDSINLFDPMQVKFYKKDPVVNIALDYIKLRRLDTAVNRPNALYISLKDKFQPNRIIIPFMDDLNKIIFYQTRKIMSGDDKPNYLSKANADKSLYGINNIDSKLDSIFLFEGPIDAFFMRNGIGVAGINSGRGNLTELQKCQLDSLSMFDKIWVLDSQWLDETARLKTYDLLMGGEKVFIWPEKFGRKFKDMNEVCVYCGKDEVSEAFIKSNCTQGVSAALKFRMEISKRC